MKITISTDDILSHKTDLLIVGRFEDIESDEERAIDKQLDNMISKSIEHKRFKGEFKESLLLTPLNKMNPDVVIVIGLGKKEEFTVERLRKVAALSSKIARDKSAKTVSTSLAQLNVSIDAKDRAQAIVEASIMALYQFNKFKTVEIEKIRKIDELILLGNKQIKTELNAGILRGLILGESVNYVRDLVNFPSAIKTPNYMAEQAKILAKENKIKIKIMNKKEIEKAGMNALLAVSYGSSQEPQFVILDYNPKAKDTVALIGKGITFDSGGLNIKVGDYMETMKCDMAGAATVMGTLLAAAQLKLNKHIIGVLPLTENMPGPSAQKPGDIIKAYNNKTIEMLNSDAEGRLILADALAYTEDKLKPNRMIDLATLTGACTIALGFHAAAILGNNNDLIEKIKDAGLPVHERVWELPMWDEYKEQVKGETADLSNIGKKGMGAGTINGATFLNAFVDKTPWAHIDIAGMAYLPDDREYMPKNGTGWGVRLLINYLEKN
jgi:leucyl aminopeptidase